MYIRKLDINGNFKQRFIKVLTTAVHAANCLSDNKINKKIEFTPDIFRFIANDRRLADNTKENQSLYQKHVISEKV